MYKINLINIKNFKSIVNIKLEEIPNFAVFAGANGSGKSNFFEALEFVRDVIKNGLVDAIKKHGGYEHIHSHKLRDKNAKRFYFKIKLNLDDEKWIIELKQLDITSFAELAINDLFVWFEHLLKLQKISFSKPKFQIINF